jgi:hypothetical protein
MVTQTKVLRKTQTLTTLSSIDRDYACFDWLANKNYEYYLTNLSDRLEKNFYRYDTAELIPSKNQIEIEVTLLGRRKENLSPTRLGGKIRECSG